MPVTVNLTEDTVQRLAPDDSALKAARGLKSKFKNLGISADGTWLLGECQGSGSKPYEVSVDLSVEAAPLGRCTCPSRKLPCKHSLGLMLLYGQTPEKFGEREPAEELLAKREKQSKRVQKADSEPAGPRKVNKAAQAKKATAQREGLDLLEKLLVDLVAAGQWFEPSHLDRLEQQSRQMNDAYLPGATVLLRRLILVGRQTEIAEEERLALGSEALGRLWATVQKGRNYLDGQLAGDEVQAEADAVIEEVLGRAWQLAELREKGYIRQNLHLLELAYERAEDEARQERIETSYLLELQDGSIMQAIAYRPFKGLTRIAGQASYAQPLKVAEAAVYPGFINRRVRWEVAAEQPQTLEPAHFAAAYARAAPAFDAAFDAFRKQLKHALAPREAVVLLRCRTIGRVGDRVVLEDAKGGRLEARDRGPDQAHTRNLLRAAGMLRNDTAVLARVFVLPASNTLVAQPLAALRPECHLRLGL